MTSSLIEHFSSPSGVSLVFPAPFTRRRKEEKEKKENFQEEEKIVRTLQQINSEPENIFSSEEEGKKIKIKIESSRTGTLIM